MPIVDPFKVEDRPKIVDPFQAPVPRGGTGDWWDKTKRIAGEVYGTVAQDVAAPVMRGVGLFGDLYANAQNQMAASTGYMTDAQGNRMFVPAAVRPELKRLADTNTPTVTPLVDPVAARVAASGQAAMPQNPSLLEKGVGAVTGFAAPLAAGPAAPLVFGAQAAGKTYEEAKAKGATEDVARRAAGGSALVNTALGMVPGEKLVAPAIARVAPKLATTAIGRVVQGVAARAGGGAIVGGGMQTGENVVAQQTYDPTRGTFQDVPQAAGAMAVAAPVMHALLSSPQGVKAFRDFLSSRGVHPDTPPEQVPPEVVVDLPQDPAVQAILQAQGIQPGATTRGVAAPPRSMADVVADKLQARAVQARAGTIAATASAARAEEQAARAALNAASTPEALAAAKSRLDAATVARTNADAQLSQLGQVVGAGEPNRPTPLPSTPAPSDVSIETLRQGMQRTTQNIPSDSAYVDPSALPVTDRPQPPMAFMVNGLGETVPADVNRPALPPEMANFPQPEFVRPQTTGALAGREQRQPSNLPVPAGPSPIPPRMSDVEIAQAQRQAQPPPTQPETAGRYVAPEDRLPQTPDQVAEARRAAEAFRLQERQRQRVAGGIRDVQPGVTTPEGAQPGDRQMGTERGPEPQQVLLDQGFPVRIVERGARGAVKVERYDPRTGKALEGQDGEPYVTQERLLRAANYTTEPRRAQDFTGRANEPKTSPELPRMAGPGRPLREPTQTYRTTQPDPNAEFPGAAPEGRSPFPEQPPGQGPWPNEPYAQTAHRAWTEEELRRQEERRQRENAKDEQDRAESARARSRQGGAGRSTGEPRGQDEEGRWFTDEDGYVMSKGGGPIVFEDSPGQSAHVKAARWIIDEGQRKSPDQIFQRVAHPTKRQSTGGRFGGTKEAVSVIEVGRSAKTAEEEAQAGAGGAGETSGAGGKAAPEAEPGPPRGLPGPEPVRAEEPPVDLDKERRIREREAEIARYEQGFGPNGPTDHDREMARKFRSQVRGLRGETFAPGTREHHDVLSGEMTHALDELHRAGDAVRAAEKSGDPAAIEAAKQAENAAAYRHEVAREAWHDHARQMAEVAKTRPEPKSPEVRGRSPAQQVADQPLPTKTGPETPEQELDRLHEAVTILDARIRTAVNGEERKRARSTLSTLMERMNALEAQQRQGAAPRQDDTAQREAIRDVAKGWRELGDEGMAKAVEAGVREGGPPVTQDQVKFQQEKLADAQRRKGGDVAPVDERDDMTLNRILDGSSGVADAKAFLADKDTPPKSRALVQSVADRIRELVGQINDLGVKVSEAHQTDPNTNTGRTARELRKEISALSGTTSRYIKQAMAVRKGYKRGDADKVLASRQELEALLAGKQAPASGQPQETDDPLDRLEAEAQAKHGPTPAQKAEGPPKRELTPEETAAHDRATAAWEAVDKHMEGYAGRDDVGGPEGERLRAEAKALSAEAGRISMNAAGEWAAKQRREARQAQTDARHEKALEHEGPHGDDHAAAMAHLDREMEKYANDKGQSIEAYDSPDAAAKGAHEVLDPIYGKEGVENGLTFKVIRRKGPPGTEHIWRWEVIDYAGPEERAGTAKTEPTVSRETETKPDHVWQKEIREARAELDAADRDMMRAKTDSEKRVAKWTHDQASAAYDKVREDAYAAGFRQEGEAPAAASEPKPEPPKDYTRQSTAWKTEAVAEDAAQLVRDDPSQRGRDVRIIYDRGAWHVEVERTPADVAAADKRRMEQAERENRAAVQRNTATRARIEKMGVDQAEREMARVDQKIKDEYRLAEKDALRSERAMLRDHLDKLRRAEAEPVDVGSGRQEGEKPKDAKARIETELDQMIAHAQSLDDKGLGETRIRYVMETASGRKTTFVMPADPVAWEGLKKRLMGGSTPPSPPQTKQTAKNLKINRFEARQTITRREALLTGAAAAATTAGTTGNARAAVTPPEARRAFVEGPIGKAIESGRAQNVLDALADHAVSPTTRWIAKIMQKAGGMGRATIGTARELDEGVAGVTSTKNGGITLRDDPASPHDGMSEEVAAHELIHSFVTSRYRSLSTYLTDNLRLLHWTPSKAKSAIDEWNAFHSAVAAAIERQFPKIGEGEGKGLEAYHQQMWSSPDELLSWSLTNKAAQDYLKGLTPTGEKAMGENMFTRFVDAVAKFFGIYHPRQTALSRALDLSSKIFEAGDAPDFKYAEAMQQKGEELGQFTKQTLNKKSEPPGSPTGSRPMSPEAVKQFLDMPNVRRARSAAEKMREDAATTARLFKDASVDPRKIGEATRQLYDFLLSSNTQAMRLIGRSKLKADPETAQMLLDYADKLGTDPGSHRAIPETWERAVQGRTGEMISRARAIVGEDAHDTDFHKQVIDVMRGLSRAAPGSRLDRVSRDLRHLMDEQYVYMRRKGLEPGYVREGYFPRVVDMAKIQRGADRDAFLKAAQRVYEGEGLTGAHRNEDGTFTGKSIAEHMAQDWLDRLMGVRDSAYGASMPHSDAIKGRALPKSADAILKPFMVDDLPAALGDYFHSTSRAAEAASRFGPNGEKRTELMNALNTSHAFNDTEKARIRQMIDSATGHLYANSLNDKPLMSDALAVWGALTYLPRATWSSLSEGAAVGVKAHDFTKGVSALADSFRELTPFRQKDDARAHAEFLGLVGDVMHDLFMSSRAGIDPNSRIARHVMGKFFRANLLTQLTEAQRVAALRVGRGVMRNLVREVATDHPGAKSAQMVLNDHGIDHDTAVKLHGLLGENKSFDLGALSTQNPAIEAYKGAIRRFVDESIQNPSMADKPTLANNPWTRAAYAIQSFTYSNTKNILAPAFKAGTTAITEPGLSPQDRWRLLNPLISLGGLTALSWAVSQLRDKLTMPEAASERPEASEIATHLSRANLFGNFDALANTVVGGARFQRNLTQSLVGPYASGVAQDVGAISNAVPNPFDDSLPPLNNTAEWNAYKAGYHLIAAPVASATAALMPEGSPWVRMGTYAMMQYLTAPQTGTDFADTMTGGRIVLPKQYR